MLCIFFDIRPRSSICFVYIPNNDSIVLYVSIMYCRFILVKIKTPVLHVELDTGFTIYLYYAIESRESY